MSGFPFYRRGPRGACVALASFLILSFQIPLFALQDETERNDVEVYLNHFFIVLDAETYQALGESQFIKDEFGGFERRTTAAGSGESWTGTYVYGEKTYIEFFKDTGDAFYQRGFCGIAYGVETVGGVDVLTGRLRRDLEGASVLDQFREMKKDDSGIPWFHYAQILYEGDEAPMLWTWVMEYHPSFLHTMAPETYPEEGAITRKEYLRRFFKDDRYLADVRSISIELNPLRAAGLVRELEIFGWDIEAQEGLTVCTGPEVVIKVSSSEAEPGGILEVVFSLLKPKEGEKLIRLGPKSRIIFGNGLEAIWRFK